MKQENVVIEVKDVYKDFKVYCDGSKSIKEMIITSGRRNYSKREVIKGISFQVHKGEAIGLIGKNGCGKSTLLKMLAKIIFPNKGNIVLEGRVSSLLELGAGFHPDMSGRENIFLNAAVFGLTHKEIEEKVDEIIDFSELYDFIDNPVRTYSSGMYMRLAFSVAINVKADILLIDEILAVGDVSFQTKCFEKLKEIKEMGTTIVIVSHSLGQIEQICDKTIWIEEGKIKEIGIPRFVHENYLMQMETQRLARIAEQISTKQSTYKIEDKAVNNREWSKFAIRSGNCKVEFEIVELRDFYKKKRIVYETGEDIVVYMRYKVNESGILGNFGVGISRDDGVYCYGTNTLIETGNLIDCGKKGDIGEMIMIIESNTLLPAKYILDVAVHTKEEIPIDKIHHILEFQVMSNKRDFGVCRLDNKWIHNGANL